MTITLTPRLQAVAQWVPAGCRFADIGTDHAYLPVWLLQKGVISRAIAGDLRRGPLDHARATAERYGYTEKMDFRLSDGLQALAPHEADCIAIAGMGGEAIRSILTAAPWTREDTRLILQPQTNLPELRVWLTEAGYRMEAERCVREDDRWYTVLLVTGGEDDTHWTPGTAIAGNPERWTREPERADYLRFLLNRANRQLKGLNQASVPDEVRIEELHQTIRELDSLLDQTSREVQL